MKSLRNFAIATIFSTILLAVLVNCGGGGGGKSASSVTTFNASAAAGDYIKVTLNSDDGTYSYENVTTGRMEMGTFIEDDVTKELDFTATSATGGGLGATSELITGFVAAEIGVALLADNTGVEKDKRSMVFGVPMRVHDPESLIGIVPPGETFEYILMQFRTYDGGFELGYVILEEDQLVTDLNDLNNNGQVDDTISGAPLYAEVYSSITGVPDPISGAPDTILSEDIVNPTEPFEDQAPFMEASGDLSHIITRAWEEPGDILQVVEAKLFFNDTLDKVIMDNPFGTAIMLEEPASGDWSSSYEGTYHVIEYNGEGVAGGLDTLTTTGTLELVFGNDGGGNGTLSVVGEPTMQDVPLQRFQDMTESLLGNPVNPWAGDGTLNGVFGFQLPAGPDQLLGSEGFFIFSSGSVFFVYAELTGPRIEEQGDLYNWPTSYEYSYGGGVMAH